MKKVFFGLFAVMFMLIASSTVSFVQTKKTVKITQKKVDASRGANPNVKSEAPTTDKPEPKARGGGAGTCKILFTNYTGYFINIYVDGYYKGQIAPYNSGTVYVGDGYTSIYGLSAGGTMEWPTQAGNCSGYYTYGFY